VGGSFCSDLHVLLAFYLGGFLYRYLHFYHALQVCTMQVDDGVVLRSFADLARSETSAQTPGIYYTMVMTPQGWR